MEDSQIIDLYLDRNENAITRTQEKYGTRLRNFSMSIVDDSMAAEECENDTYWQAWRSIPPNTPREHFYAYLATITRHLSLNLCRSRKALKRSALVVELSDELLECIPGNRNPEAEMESHALQESLNGFLRGLSQEKRNLFLRRYWYLDSISDLSRRFGISESKVKVTLFRCRSALRQRLKKEGYEL